MEEENIYLTLSCTGVWLPIRFLSNTHSTKEISYTLQQNEHIETNFELVETSSDVVANVTKISFFSAKSLRKIMEIIQFLKSKFDTYFYCKLQITILILGT